MARRGQNDTVVKVAIDFGTVNTVVSYINPNTLQQSILTLNNKRNVKSAVYYLPSAAVVVGYDAYIQIGKKVVITSIKRILGRLSGDSAVKEYESAAQIDLVPNSEPRLMVMDRVWKTPVEIATEIFKHIYTKLEEVTHSRRFDLSLTVPAFTTSKQRSDTEKAATAAGFTVKCMLEEPVAAALFSKQELNNLENMTRILVYDFGGGTFDCSLIEQAADSLKVVAVDGVPKLGGDDVDQELCDYIVNEFSKQQRELILNLKQEPRWKRIILPKLRQWAQVAKEDLSINPFHEIHTDSDEGPIIEPDLVVQLTPAILENIAQPFVTKSQEVVMRMLSRIGMNTTQVDAVLLVGGSSHLKCVQTMLKNLFGERKLIRTGDPSECVSRGALSYLDKPLILDTVLPMSIGMECQDRGKRVMDVIWESGVKLPTVESPATIKYYTLVEELNSCKVRVLQGNNPEDADMNNALGSISIKKNAKYEGKKARYGVNCQVNKEGRIHVRVTEECENVKQEIVNDYFDAMLRG